MFIPFTHPSPERPTRALLIFNPVSGTPGESPAQLMTLINELQARRIQPEVTLVEPGKDITRAVKDAYRRGVRVFVASGGDGTVNSVAAVLAGSQATLAIIPTGTQNNVAFSLGIPADIPGAVALFENGRHVAVDMGIAACGDVKRPFLETASVGLLSALFPSADDIQHGNLARIGDFLATLVQSPPAEMHLTLDRRTEVNTQGHVVLVGNMPYTGPRLQVAPDDSYADGLLEVLVFANLSKLDLIGAGLRVATGSLDDPRIRRYHVHSVEIHTEPPMPVLVDGFTLGSSPLNISLRRNALKVLAGPTRAEQAAPAEGQ